MSNPKVTVVTVCFNAIGEIEETILSVINQTYPNIEYVIIDGGSTDGTVDIIKKYHDHINTWISEPDHGIYDAMNKGVLRSTGQWVNFMNAGDSFCSDSVVEEFMSKVESDTTIAYGNTVLVYELGERLDNPGPLEGLSKGMIFGHQSAFVDLDYHKNHLFDTSFRSSGDYNFFYKSYIEGVKFQYIDISVAKYKAQGGMSSSNWEVVEREDARIRGIDNTVKWKLFFFLMKANIGIREFLKKYLPGQLVKQAKMYHLKKIGCDISRE